MPQHHTAPEVNTKQEDPWYAESLNSEDNVLVTSKLSLQLRLLSHRGLSEQMSWHV